MTNRNQFDVIIVGGSYSGLAAAMTLGRSLRDTLIIDSGLPCNRQTPYSHNFITQDGKTPREITSLAKDQVGKYNTVTFLNGIAKNATKTEIGFDIETASGEIFQTRKILFASGIRDVLGDIPGISECWGISVIHCPYCHGYEVRNQKTGILGNGEYGFEFSSIISHWTNDLTLYTNGKSTLTKEQSEKLRSHNIQIAEDEVEKLDHVSGSLHHIVFKSGQSAPVQALYTRAPFVQHCTIPESIGCEINSDGYIQVDPFQKTTVYGLYASGDNTTRVRTVANAVAMGTTAGMMINRELIEEDF